MDKINFHQMETLAMGLFCPKGPLKFCIRAAQLNRLNMKQSTYTLEKAITGDRKRSKQQLCHRSNYPTRWYRTDLLQVSQWLQQCTDDLHREIIAGVEMI